MCSYNLEGIKEMAGGDEEFMTVVVQTFLEEIPPDVEAMNDAIKNGNASLAYQYAHKMKPNFQLFGLELFDQVRTIESWAKAGKKKEKVPEAAAVISKKVQVACIALKRDFDIE